MLHQIDIKSYDYHVAKMATEERAIKKTVGLIIKKTVRLIIATARRKNEHVFPIARTPEGRSLSCNTFGCDITEIVSTS